MTWRITIGQTIGLRKNNRGQPHRKSLRECCFGSRFVFSANAAVPSLSSLLVFFSRVCLLQLWLVHFAAGSGLRLFVKETNPQYEQVRTFILLWFDFFLLVVVVFGCWLLVVGCWLLVVLLLLLLLSSFFTFI